MDDKRSAVRERKEMNRLRQIRIKEMKAEIKQHLLVKSALEQRPIGDMRQAVRQVFDALYRTGAVEKELRQIQ